MADRSHWSPVMPGYRFYTIGKDGHFAGVPSELDCPNDQAAMQEAKKVPDGHAIEVWAGARLVVRLEPAQD
jgi:hypothetical protein